MPNRKGFSLIEILVVTTLIALLAALLFPVFVEAKARAYRTSCGSNLRQIGQAFAMYRADNDGYLPPVAPSAGMGTKFRSSLKPYAPEAVHICSTGPYGYLYRLFIVNSDPVVTNYWERNGIHDHPAGAYWEPAGSFVLGVCYAHLTKGWSIKDGKTYIQMLPASGPQGRQGMIVTLRADGSVADVNAQAVKQYVPQIQGGKAVWSFLPPGMLPPPLTPIFDRYPGEPAFYDVPEGTPIQN